MRSTRGSATSWLLSALLLVAGVGLWTLHVSAWKPGLGYEAARHLLVARELSEHGRLATSFALPIQLVRHPRPPWPADGVEPAWVVTLAAVERLAPRAIAAAERERILLALALATYLALALGIFWAGRALIARAAPSVSEPTRLAAASALALSYLLDPEARHLASGAGHLLPGSLGVLAALTLIATGAAARRPFWYGLLLGSTAGFLTPMPWLAPALALAGASAAAPGDRLRVLLSSLAGCALVIAPWWIHLSNATGSPFGELSRWAWWDGVQGRTWFTMLHLPELPQVPDGIAALTAIASKTSEQTGRLLLALATGPRALWIGALVVWLATRPPRPLAAAGAAAAVLGALGVLGAAATLPRLSSLFPVRLPLEIGGMLGAWALVRALPTEWLAPASRRFLTVGVAALALGWGSWRLALDLNQARAAERDLVLPSSATLADLAQRLDRELPRDEPVMSNLGPTFAYYSRRPVLHLVLAPADLDACRARLTFAHLVLVFEDGAHSWPAWDSFLSPGGEREHPEWNVVQVRRWRSSDGFSLVWLELGPPRPRLAWLSGDPRVSE